MRLGRRADRRETVAHALFREVRPERQEAIHALLVGRGWHPTNQEPGRGEEWPAQTREQAYVYGVRSLLGSLVKAMGSAADRSEGRFGRFVRTADEPPQFFFA